MKPVLEFYAGPALLEGPVWDEKSRMLMCVSIERCLIYMFSVDTGVVKTFATHGQVGCAVLKDGYILSAEEDGIYRIDPDTSKSEFVLKINTDSRMRYNDGKLDPTGRFIVGTKGLKTDYPGEAALYSWDGKSVSTIVTGTTISNGLGFSPDNRYMYFIDTPVQKVGRYKYDIDSGIAEFDRYIVTDYSTDVFPDGMCVDTDGMIWVAEWGGSRVCKWDPETGEKLTEILLPCKYVSSCCLGGNNLERLYITTARGSDSDDIGGALFSADITTLRGK